MMFMSALPLQAQVIYVDDSSTGPVEDGSSWCSAFVNLQDALEFARQPANGVSEIRVAQGTYYPDDGALQTPDDSESSFELVDNVHLGGGYAGCGQPDPDARDFILFPTIFSGDIQQDDDLVDGYECCLSHDEPGCFDQACQEQICPDGEKSGCCAPESMWSPLCAGTAADFCKVELTGVCNNARHVVSSDIDVASTTLEGVIIQKGCGRDSSNEGAGLRSYAGQITVRDVKFRHNYHATRVGGGAAAATAFNADFERCVFRNNESHIYQFGRATVSVSGESSFQDCDFIANQFFDSTVGTLGVALDVFIDSNVTIDRCRFIGNRNTSHFAYGGAISAFDSNLTITNSLVADNGPAWRGGGIHSAGDLSTLTILNCTIAQNFSTINDVGAGIWMQSRNPLRIENSIIWGNQGDGAASFDEQVFLQEDVSPILQDSCIQNLTNLTGGNINDDPRFVDTDGVDNVSGTADDDYRLAAVSNIDVSPCVDAGDDIAIPADTLDADNDGDVDEPLPFDADGNTRQVALLPGTPIGQSVDIGAYEVQSLFATNAGSRYLQVTPQSIVSGDVAIRLTSDDFPCLDNYVDADGTLTDLPVFMPVAGWSTVSITDESFVPSARYTVSVEDSEALELIRTDVVLSTWGDVDNTGTVNFGDIQLIVIAFQQGFNPAADLEPCVPNGLVNFADILEGVLAFQGGAFAQLNCAPICSR